MAALWKGKVLHRTTLNRNGEAPNRLERQRKCAAMNGEDKQWNRTAKCSWALESNGGETRGIGNALNGNGKATNSDANHSNGDATNSQAMERKCQAVQ